MITPEIMLLTDLRILHARLREAYSAVYDIKARYAQDEIVRFIDISILSETIQYTDKISDWITSTKQLITGEPEKEHRKKSNKE